MSADAIKLLLVEKSAEDAERLNSALRHAGIAARVAQARDASELEARLRAQTPDLILAGSALELGAVVRMANHDGQDIAVIAILDDLTGAAAAEAFRQGAAAVATREQAELLAGTIQREFDNLQSRRDLRRLETHLAEAERRCARLFESAREPIAYVHEGAHVRANQAWLEAFAYADFEELQGVSILDLIAPEAAGEFKALLKNLSRGEAPPTNLPIKLRRADGSTFDMAMEFATVGVGGEACQQIVLRQPHADAQPTCPIDTPQELAADSQRPLRERIEAAIGNRHFFLYGQPLINLHGAEGEFHEILPRLADENGEAPADVFLPLAEDAGLAPAIDRIVIAKAIAAIAEREKAGRRTTFFVKLAAASMADTALPAWLAQQLETANVHGNALVFEMPENQVFAQLSVARALVGELHRLRCGFAIEQFGEGANSFELLRHIDANYLKIDRGRTHDLLQDQDRQEFVRRFCEQARQAGKSVIAEAIDNPASLSFLFTCGVNFVQGGHLRAPEKIDIV
jgi:PAS domain S-box-containing protein